MLHDQTEIDGAWVEGTIRSSKGDVAHVRVNSVSKEVWTKTRIGDGNSQEWRKTNSTYAAVLAQGFTPIVPGEPVPAVVEAALPAPAAVREAAGNNGGVKPLDLESVAPFGKRARKHSE